MSKIKCLIIDDEPVAQRILETYLLDLPHFELVGKCLNALVARQVLEEQKIDLMFLDLEMPKLKGFSFLKTLTNPPAVIITTAHREYALEGYELEVTDYLLKPVSFERFIKAINRFKKNHKHAVKQEQLPPSEAEFIYVRSNRKTLKLHQAEICFIEGMNNYIKIHCGEKMHIVYTSLQSILNELGDQFIRIHKSYIVNKNKISSFTNEQLEIAGKQLPIGSTYRDAIGKF